MDYQSLSTDDLIGHMATVGRWFPIHTNSYAARATDCSYFAYGATPREAMIAALKKRDDTAKPTAKPAVKPAVVTKAAPPTVAAPDDSLF